MVVACSEIALDLVENRTDWRVVSGIFGALVDSLIVMNTAVATVWRWAMCETLYWLMWETFVNDLRMGLAYHLVAEVVEGARNRVRFPLITFSVLLIVITCVYVLHYTALHLFLTSAREPVVHRSTRPPRYKARSVLFHKIISYFCNKRVI
jgi:hypothetical protein